MTKSEQSSKLYLICNQQTVIGTNALPQGVIIPNHTIPRTEMSVENGGGKHVDKDILNQSKLTSFSGCMKLLVIMIT